MDFRPRNGEKLRLRKALKASATVIEPGDLVAIDTGLIIKATAASAALAYCPDGGANGVTEIEVTEGNDFTLRGKGDTNFAVAQKGTEVDLVVNTNEQQIDLGASSTKVLKVSLGEDAGTVGAATDIEVRINKPIF